MSGVRTVALLATIALAVALSFGQTVPAGASATFTVNNEADAVDGNPGDGACLTAASNCTLRAATQEANALPGADTIVIPAGHYTLSIEAQPAGGQQPVDTAAVGDLDITDSATIIGAGQARTIIDGAHIDRVLDIHTTTAGLTVAISGVTVTNGQTSSNEFGAGIRANGPTGTAVSITDSTITANKAQYGGGLNLQTNVDATVSHSRLTLNEAVVDGGAINVDDQATLHVNDAVITGNKADSAGGIMNTDQGTVTVTRSTIDDNTVTTYGGGVFNGSVTNISDTSISSNTAQDNGGGGVYTAGGAILISTSTIANNTAGGDGNGGGGVQQDAGGTLDIINTTIFGNTSATIGGGILIQDIGPTNITNSTIVGNSGQAGIYLRDDGPITLKNTILADNGDNCDNDPGIGDMQSAGHNFTDDLTCGLHKPGDLVGSDPKLGGLSDNGGPTQTMDPLPGSPVIDTGDDVGCPATDQRGAPRPFDGDSDAAAHCDIGAVEAGLIGYIWGDLRCDGANDGTDGLDELLHMAELPLLQATEPCPDLGSTVEVAGFSPHVWGDLDCNGSIDGPDLIAILREIGGLPPVAGTPPCPSVGAAIFIH